MSQPQYRKNSGSPNQLPQGAAKSLNDAAAQASDGQGNSTPAEGQTSSTEGTGPSATPSLPPVKRAQRLNTSQFVPPNEDDELLFGPTGRPDEHIMAGVSSNAAKQLPPGSERWIPALAEAAQDPEAPQMFKDMLQLMQHHLNEGR